MTALAKARSDIKAAHARERVARLAQYPSTEEVLTDAESLGPRLWSRRPEHPEFLQLRLGIGSEVPRTEVEGMDDATALPVHQEMIQEVRAVNDQIVSVPVVANLREDGSLGVDDFAETGVGMAYAELYFLIVGQFERAFAQPRTHIQGCVSHFTGRNAKIARTVM